MTWLLLSIVLLITVRIPFIQYLRRTGEHVGGDSTAQYVFYSLVRKNFGRICGLHDDTYLLDPARKTAFAYPLGLHKMLYHLGCSQAFLEKWGGYIPTICDAGLLVVLYVGISQFGGTHFFWLVLVPLQQIFVTHRGRSYSFNERAFGVLMSTIYFLGVYGVILQGWTWYWIACSMAGFFGFAVSSKFSYQATAFISFLVSILTANPFFILYWCGHVLIMLPLSGGYIWEVIQGSVHYLHFYRKHFAEIAGHKAKTLFYDCLFLPKYLVQGNRKKCLSAWYHNPLWQILSALPLNIFLVDLLLHGEWNSMMAMWSASIIVVCIISLRPLRFLGAPERYMEYAFLPMIVILSSVSYAQFALPLWILFFMILLSSGVYFTKYWFALHSEELLQKMVDTNEAIDFLQKEALQWEGRKVLLSTFPRFPHGLQLKSNGYQYVGFISGVHPDDIDDMKELFPETIYLVANRLLYFVEKYNVSYIVMDKIMQRNINRWQNKQYYTSPPGSIIFENQSICIRKIRNPSTVIDTPQCSIKNDTDVKECIAVRGGLGDLQKKLSSKRCAIAYMGSSVTAQTNGYRPYLHNYICDTWQQEHKEINAGIGGVTSMTGLYLMQEKVLDEHPDVCFIDYSVSDTYFFSVLQLQETVEVMIRKFLAANCQVCIIHSYGKNFHPTDRIRQEYDKIAEYYHIPVIDVGCILRKEFASGIKTHEQIFIDDLHTDGKKNGGQYIAKKMFHVLYALLSSDPHQSNMKEIQKKPLYCQEKSIQQIHTIQKEHSTHPKNMRVGHFQKYTYMHIDSHNTIEISFVGEMRGILYVAGPESGIIQVTYKEDSKEYNLWDKYCHYDRINTKHIHPIVSDGSSPVRIQVTEKPIDYSLCRRQIPHVDTLQKSIKIIGCMVESH